MDRKCLSSTDNVDDTQWLPCLIILVVLSFLGTSINSFVLFIFSRMKSVFKNANKFLVTLIVGQLILTLFVGPFRILQIVSTTDTTSCHMKSIKDYINSLILISGVSNGVVSYDRYLHVALAHNYKVKMKGFVVYLLLSLPWLSTLLYLLSILFGELVNYSVLIIITVMLILILLVNYIRLIKSLNAHHAKLVSGMQSKNLRKKRNTKAKLLCIYVMIIEFTGCAPGLATLICGFVNFSTGMKWVFWQQNNAIIKEVSLIFLLISVCINPFVYLYSHREFKQYVRKLFFKNKVGQASGDMARNRNVRRQSGDSTKDNNRGDAAMAMDMNRLVHDTEGNYTMQSSKVSRWYMDGENRTFTAASSTGHK